MSLWFLPRLDISRVGFSLVYTFLSTPEAKSPSLIVEVMVN